MLTTNSLPPLQPARDTIINAYRMDETKCLNTLIPAAQLDESQVNQTLINTKTLIATTRAYKKQQGKIDALLHQYDLSTEEGIALMCLAEALLRIPDKATMDKFISDKLSTANWSSHLTTENGFFLNAATWSLLITGKVYKPLLENKTGMQNTLKRTISRLGAGIIRPIIMQMMKTIGNQFVMGESIEDALARARRQEELGYRYSYDMLGEAARTQSDADTYFNAYVHAIHAIGKHANHENPVYNPGISIKLSALHPRYEFAKHDLVLPKIVELLLKLTSLAKQYNIGLTIDAEEADRLDLSLDIFAAVFTHPSLGRWDGFGLAVQAYQKRAYYVLDWLKELSTQQNRRIMVRLVKGAYWDAEIKLSQIQGFNNYPVFTRKNATDVSYLACAKKMLTAPEQFFPQFATHNAYSVAAIMTMAADHRSFEFQCLHGMGQPLYDQIVDRTQYNIPCRIYAPVGSHRDLLGYLVRRLLENGANSSFVNRLADETIPIEKIAFDPVARMASLTDKAHPLIPLPKDIYHDWQNSMGVDLSNAKILAHLKTAMDKADITYQAASIVDGASLFEIKKSYPVVAPSDLARQIGQVTAADNLALDAAISSSTSYLAWGKLAAAERAEIIERVADALQNELPTFLTLLTREGGRTIPDSIAEIREAIDFCRYYAYCARHDLQAKILPGPTGEHNELRYCPRGTIVCISPWNFPLAIFTGQIIAALAAGNNVIAKPAEQTPLIAFKTIQLMHLAGIPVRALQLLLGDGEIGAKLVADPRIAGVMFTGSTQTAQHINQSLAARPGPIGMLIAETGGQNAMIVDSSALSEQAVIDIVNSAFNSAGQRCSALRVLYVQEEMAPRLITMLQGYMQELELGEPSLLSTDIGPVIDHEAREKLFAHHQRLLNEAQLIATVPIKNNLNGYYFAPCAFQINDIKLLTGEVFGPILHIITYRAENLRHVIDDILATGFGLTFGIHSRIDATVQQLIEEMAVGNIYVNRNIIGAVVGVQPFGGQGLSGTGPKAGGPNYLHRLVVEKAISINTTAVGGNAKLVSLLEED